MLVKHIHYFANSARAEAVHSPYSSPAVSPWEDFKRQIIPCFIQKKVYTFLKHSFEKWPLDASFRQVGCIPSIMHKLIICPACRFWKPG
jgi:sphingomyelin phosphodiesterase 4